MPNTFAMAPGYIARYAKANDLKPPKVDPIAFLEQRTAHVRLPSGDYRRGRAWRQDARAELRWPRTTDRAKLIFTSPPYLEVMKYGKFNWIRLWLLGHNSTDVDASLFTTSSEDKYLAFISDVIKNLRTRLRDDGYLCLVLGDVARGEEQVNLASRVAAKCLAGTDLRTRDVITDRIPARHKVSRIWKDSRGRATKTDRVLILSPPKAEALPTLTPIRWRDA